jgi:hypothetical protein
MMRLPLIAPADLTPEQKSLYDDMREGIASNFNAFKVLRDDGALMGPWNPWLHETGIGKAIWDFTLAMTANATLPDNVRLKLNRLRRLAGCPLFAGMTTRRRPPVSPREKASFRRGTSRKADASPPSCACSERSEADAC